MRSVIALNQALLYLFFAPLVRYFFKSEIIYQSQDLSLINRNNSLVLISNHTSKLDPFVVLSGLPPKVYFHLLPIFFMTSNNYLKTPLQKLILIPLGCFPHKTESSDYSSIEKSLSLLAKDSRVFIFPEGGIAQPERPLQAKRGVGAIYSRGGIPVLPIHIKGLENFSLKKLLTRRLAAKISIGKMIDQDNSASDPKVIAKNLMMKVYELS